MSVHDQTRQAAFLDAEQVRRTWQRHRAPERLVRHLGHPPYRARVVRAQHPRGWVDADD